MRHSEDTLSGKDTVPSEPCQISSRVGEDCREETVNPESHQDGVTAGWTAVVRFLRVKLLRSTCNVRH